MQEARFTPTARLDLLEAWIHIADNSLSAADRVIDSITAAATLLATQPMMGRARPELGKDVRSIPTDTPYILFYRSDSDRVTVLRVIHHARDLGEQTF